MQHVVQRWGEAWKTIPWPDSLAMKLNILCPSNAEESDDELMSIKQTIMRYANLSIIETFRIISSPVRKRFPTYQSLINAGLMTHTEMNILKSAKSKSKILDGFESGHWLPLNWAGNLLMKVHPEKMICKRYVSDIVGEINNIRGGNGALLAFDWVGIPIKFTQIVTIGVYAFFFIALFGSQSLDISEGRLIPGYENADGIFDNAPFYLALEFLFYVGWLKAAEALIDPFGDDDDDFEMNYIIDRNLLICYLYFGGAPPHFVDVKKGSDWNVEIPNVASYNNAAALPICSTNVYKAVENQTVALDQQKEIVIDDFLANSERFTYLNGDRRVSAGTARYRKVSDSQCFRSEASKTNISIISSLNFEERSSLCTVGNENQRISNKNVLFEKGTLV
jgi:hypothetical protein